MAKSKPSTNTAGESPKPAPEKARTKKFPNRAVEAILEMADDQFSSGLITQAEHDEITNRHSRPPTPGAAKPTLARSKKKN